MRIICANNKIIDVINFRRSESNCSLSDYFKDTDVVCFQAVTVGDKVNKEIEELSVKKEMTKAFFLHGLSVYLAEALAEFFHYSLIKELGLKKGQGKRYSPGYPLWKELKDQEIIFRILDVPKKLGIELTSEYQMIPEQSTTAMIVYNDDAEY